MSTTTTIKVGETAKTITLPEGKALTIKPTPGTTGTAGVAYLLDPDLGGTNSKASWAIGSAAMAQIGPYEGIQKVLITCTAGSIDAVVGDAVLVAPIFNVVNSQLLARPDGSNVRFTGQIGYSLGVIGDSRDDIAFSEYLTGSSPGNFYQPGGSLKWALGRAGHPFFRTSDWAKSGSGCTSVVGTVHPTYQEQRDLVLADMPTHCWVRTPINDLLNGMTAVATWPYFFPIVDSLIAAGIKVELLTCSSLAPNFSPGYNATAQQEILKLNAMVRARYGTSGGNGVVLHDVASVATVPGNTSFNGIALAYKDAVHHANIGAWMEGAMIAQSWIDRGLKPIPLLANHAADAYRSPGANYNTLGAVLSSGSNNYVANGTFELGTPVSGLAQGWYENGKNNCTVSYSIVTAPAWDGRVRGNAQRCTVTWTGANGYVELWGPNMFGDIQFMKHYIAAALISIADNPVNLRNVRVVLQVYASKDYGSAWSLMDSGDTGALPITTGYHEVALMDLDLAKVPDLAAGGGNRFQVMFIISGGPGTSGSATVDFSGVAVRMVN